MDAEAATARREPGDVAGASALAPPPEAALCFRDWTLLPAARLLLHAGRPVTIGSRAFDLLHVLLRSRGVIVERAEIFRRVWPTTVVDESNLRFQVSCLRKVLGADRDLLKTVPGRGYLMAADVDLSARETGAAAARSAEDLRTLLQQVLAELRDGRSLRADDG